jgi:hypothetical protein
MHTTVKPFNFKNVHFGPDVQENIKTSSGDSVILLGVFSNHIYGGIVGLNELDNAVRWELDGSCLDHPWCKLVEVTATTKVEGFLNVYKTAEGESLYFHLSRSTADSDAGESRVACVPFAFSYYKGEGL